VEVILIGLTSLIVRNPPFMPNPNRKRALFVLSRIESILSWEQSVEHDRDTKFLELGRYLCEVRAGQYWRVQNFTSFDDFLAHRFPDSRRKAYYLMSIHEHLPKQNKKDLLQIGWRKAAELVKVARSDKQRFESAPWVHKAKNLPREEFRHEVEKYLTGKDSEPSDLVYFKLYKSQMPVIEQAIETAAFMLGSDKSRGYCLEMICADFLAGAHASGGDPAVLLQAVLHSYKLMPSNQQITFLSLIKKVDDSEKVTPLAS
jgi:hypothetical protein